MFFITILKIIRKRDELEKQESLLNNELMSNDVQNGTIDAINAVNTSGATIINNGGVRSGPEVININFNCNINNNTVVMRQDSEEADEYDENLYDQKKIDKPAKKV
jgi:hypothetical protein